MNLATYDFAAEPRGEAYRGLLHAAVTSCASFMLVIRDDNPIAESGRAVIEDLAQVFIGATAESEWPGTKLLDHTATVYRFEMTAASIDYLASATDRLYAWLQPDLPEDLCLLRPDGSPWLGSSSHEEWGFLVLSEQEKADVLEQIPGLALNTRSSG